MKFSKNRRINIYVQHMSVIAYEIYIWETSSEYVSTYKMLFDLYER